MSACPLEWTEPSIVKQVKLIERKRISGKDYNPLDTLETGPGLGAEKKRKKESGKKISGIGE